MEKIGAIEKELSAEERLSVLIDSYQKLVFSICYKVTGDYFIAEDLAQETFLSAYQKYDSFDGANEKAWICRIATNKSIDYIRGAERRMVPVEELFDSEQMPVDDNTPEHICIEEELKEKLQSCCASLKPPYDEIAREYYLEEKNAAEIAQRRAQNIKTIQTQIYRARDMLKRLYGKEGFA